MKIKDQQPCIPVRSQIMMDHRTTRENKCIENELHACHLPLIDKTSNVHCFNKAYMLEYTRHKPFILWKKQPI
ncbi:hypothetical protein QVD17_29673 [Tagetes erecta]|uniref:Uncharacterized protein n=1 Tax=Tagetes erecta TaxID=13708 RepID=A0AAD8K3Y5_TARER|nr:hypothetical protein QVD17_29673 [Tagetes erecta]